MLHDVLDRHETTTPDTEVFHRPGSANDGCRDAQRLLGSNMINYPRPVEEVRLRRK